MGEGQASHQSEAGGIKTSLLSEELKLHGEAFKSFVVDGAKEQTSVRSVTPTEDSPKLETPRLKVASIAVFLFLMVVSVGGLFFYWQRASRKPQALHGGLSA